MSSFRAPPTRRMALAGLAAAGCRPLLAEPGGRPSTPAPPTPVRPPPPAPSPPAALVGRLAAVVAGFPDSRYGVAVRDVDAGWTASVDGARLYPQQSVAKLWTALAVLDAVDRGRLTLDRPVRVTTADLSVFHQPLSDKLVDGVGVFPVDALLTGALAQSDNACDDVLIRLVGGPPAVQSVVDARGLHAIRAGPLERDLQCAIAGLPWRPEYSQGHAFQEARERLDPAYRRRKLDAYLADPPEGAAPDALAAALARLARGELLSPASTAHILAILDATTTGPQRLKAGLPPGWRLAHKTGTGQDLGELSTGYNDVGLATAPDGARYAVAAMIAVTSRPVPERMATLQATARALAEWRAGAVAAR